MMELLEIGIWKRLQYLSAGTMTAGKTLAWLLRIDLYPSGPFAKDRRHIKPISDSCQNYNNGLRLTIILLKFAMECNVQIT